MMEATWRTSGMLTLLPNRVKKTAMMLLCLILLLYLLTAPPVFISQECPAVYGMPIPPHLQGDHVVRSDVMLDCAKIIAGDKEELARGALAAKCTPRNSISAERYTELTTDCESFRRTRGYMTSAPHDEADFPLAFSILMFEHVEQTERLLRAIYRPHNSYCIHVDAKSPPSVQTAVQSIARCLKNVFVASVSVDVQWAWFPVLEAELICMRELLTASPTWKYFINLTGREFPLRTNAELTQILRAYNGANDIDGTLWRRPVIWTKYHWRNENWMSWREKSPTPHGYNVAKGSTHIAATRDFVQFTVYHKTSQDLLNWMRDIRSPDEHFFPTLNHNPQLGVPGAYTENPDFKHFLTRFKVWESKGEKCAGRWFRFICNFGLGDLPRITAAPELFVNKFRAEFDPMAYDCMEQWFQNRTKRGVGPGFNITFYARQPWVKHHSA